MNSKLTIQNKFKKILTIKNKKERIELKVSMMHLNIMSEIGQIMEQQSVNKTQLAYKLNVSKSYITQLFTADKIINLKLIAQIQEVFNVKFRMTLFGDYMTVVSKEKQAFIHELAEKENISTEKLVHSILDTSIENKKIFHDNSQRNIENQEKGKVYDFNDSTNSDAPSDILKTDEPSGEDLSVCNILRAY